MIQQFKRLLHPLLSFFLRIELQLHRFFIRALKSRGNRNQKILIDYLAIEREIHGEFIDFLSMDVGSGSHPKHHFDFRSEDFLFFVRPDQLILDVACGSARLSKKLVARGCSVVGIDLQTQPEKTAQLELIQADILEFDYQLLRKRHPFQVAIFSHILEHLDQPIELLKRVGAPEILVCVPSRENWLKQLKLKLGLSDLTDPTHRKEYTRQALRTELEEAGYRIESMAFNGEGEIFARGIFIQ
jgi:hypothetical protein